MMMMMRLVFIGRLPFRVLQFSSISIRRVNCDQINRRIAAASNYFDADRKSAAAAQQKMRTAETTSD